MGRVSRRDPLTEGAGNLSKSDPRGSRGRKLNGGFPRTLPNGLWSMLSTRKKEKEVSRPLALLPSQLPFPLLPQPPNRYPTARPLSACQDHSDSIKSSYTSGADTGHQGPLQAVRGQLSGDQRSCCNSSSESPALCPQASGSVPAFGKECAATMPVTAAINV